MSPSSISASNGGGGASDEEAYSIPCLCSCCAALQASTYAILTEALHSRGAVVSDCDASRKRITPRSAGLHRGRNTPSGGTPHRPIDWHVKTRGVATPALKESLKNICTCNPVSAPRFQSLVTEKRQALESELGRRHRRRRPRRLHAAVTCFERTSGNWHQRQLPHAAPLAASDV